MRFYYAYPTRMTPAGGIKQIRLTVSLLNEMGYRALLLRNQQFWSDPPREDDAHFYGIDSPTAPFPLERAGHHLHPEDVLILPETSLYKTLTDVASWDVRIGINSQNGFATLRDRPLRRALLGRIEFAVSNAPYVTHICHHSLGVPWERVFLVPHWMVRPPFVARTPRPDASLSIAFMPRKIPHVTQRIREQLQAIEPDVPWIPIDNRPEAEVVELMRSSRVFFAAHHLEGCPMPALEAMLCGSIVAGFPGTRNMPHAYANASNGFWASDDSVSGGVRALRQAISVARERGTEYQQRVEAGHRTVKSFERQPVEAALKRMVLAVEARSYPTLMTEQPRMGVKGQMEFLSRQYSKTWFRTRLGQFRRLATGDRQSLRPDLRWRG